jgi:hypothetical protein
MERLLEIFYLIHHMAAVSPAGFMRWLTPAKPPKFTAPDKACCCRFGVGAVDVVAAVGFTPSTPFN